MAASDVIEVLRPLDIYVSQTVHHAVSSSGPALFLMAGLSLIGGGWGALFVVPLVARERTRQVGRALALVLASQAITVFLLKRVVGRVRPFGSVDGVRALVFDAPGDFSFPSGHAAGSFAFAVFLALVVLRAEELTPAVRRGGAALLVLLATGVGLSRIALGVHFPSDVLAGAVLGSAFAYGGAAIYRRSKTSAVV